MAQRLADYVDLAIAIHGAAVVVVNITPTPKDNEALGTIQRIVVKAYRAIELLAGIFNTHNVKR